MNAGRPREEAPEGYYTIRDAAEHLNVSENAIRNRINRGTLPSEEHMLENRETRRYILKEAIDKELRERELPATRADTGEVQLNLERFLQKLSDAALAEIRENREVIAREVSSQREQVLEELRKQGRERHQQFEYIIELARRLEEESRRNRDEAREAREQEKEYQRQALELMRSSRRSFWSKLFGR